ncbi:MAG: shikimate kinase [Actinomycetaceae bacterium]|nr:shikimate kinase [Actinomycetaceae bacterium]
MSVRAVFIGMPGSGKSTVGRLVAKALGVESRDSDEFIVERDGRTIPEIFAEDGEKGFRAIEAACVSEALADFDGILSLGGGAVLTESTRRALVGHPVFLIDVPADELVRRITTSTTARPLVDDDPEVKVAQLLAEREDLYRQCAAYTVSSDSGPAWKVARRVLDHLGENVPVEGEQP